MSYDLVAKRKTPVTDSLSAAHTPTPWKMETVKTQVGVCHKIGVLGSSTKMHYACLYDDSYSDQPRDMQLLADAEFIVRAVNSHQMLLDACQGFLSEYTSPIPDFVMRAHWIQKMKSAIEEATREH